MGQSMLIVQLQLQIHLYPALSTLTPTGIKHGVHLSDLDFRALFESTQFGICCVGTIIQRHAAGAKHRGPNRQHNIIKSAVAVGCVIIIPGQSSVVGISQWNPALFKPTPTHTVHHSHAGDCEFFSLKYAVNNGKIHARTVAHVDCTGRHLNFQAAIGQRTVAGNAFILLPVGIQGHTVSGVIQNRDSGAAGGRCKPASKTVAFICRHGQGLCRKIAVVALRNHIPGASVGLIEHITVVLGCIIVIFAVEPHIGFHQSASNQARQEFTASGTIDTEGKNQLVFRNTIQDCPGYSMVFIIQQRTAQIIGHGNQRIELALGHFQPMPVNKAVDLAFKLCQLLRHQRVRLVHGDALFLIARQMLTGTGGAEAYRPLAIIPIRDCIEALHLFDVIHTHFTD